MPRNTQTYQEKQDALLSKMQEQTQKHAEAYERKVEKEFEAHEDRIKKLEE